ncbi:hypothetical protein AGMMS49965_12000 [Bacteroidia bacterium]|nr:hypothetical protein AGMMS49965_12000 [Bacteroidia bacterium]
MRTINIQISDLEYTAFGFDKDQFFFSEFADLMERQLARRALNHSVELAQKYSLSSMTMDEISTEVMAVRQCRK